MARVVGTPLVAMMGISGVAALQNHLGGLPARGGGQRLAEINAMEQAAADDFVQGVVPAQVFGDADGSFPSRNSPAECTASVSVNTSDFKIARTQSKMSSWRTLRSEYDLR